MNYLNHYKKLIRRSRNRETTGYVERHHIIPRSIGGSDNNHNIVYLYPEEHLIAHLLLHKIKPEEDKLLYAADMMTKTRRVNNKQYKWVKEKYASMLSSRYTGMERVDINVDEIQNLLKDNTVKQTADALGVDPSVIRHRIKKYNLIVNKLSKNILNKQSVLYYLEEMDVDGISVLYGIHKQVVVNFCNRNNIDWKKKRIAWNKMDIDISWLGEELKTKSPGTISNHIGVDVCVINRIIKENELNIKTKNKKPLRIDIDLEWLQEELRTKSDYTISREHNINIQTIKRRIKDNNLIVFIEHKMKHEIEIDIEWLQKELKNKTIGTIAKELKVDYSTIKNRVLKYKLKVHKKGNK